MCKRRKDARVLSVRSQIERSGSKTDRRDAPPRCVCAYLWGMCCVRSWWNSGRGERSCLHSGPASQVGWCCSLLRSGTWRSLPPRSDLHKHNTEILRHYCKPFFIGPDRNLHTQNFHEKIKTDDEFIRWHVLSLWPKPERSFLYYRALFLTKIYIQFEFELIPYTSCCHKFSLCTKCVLIQDLLLFDWCLLGTTEPCCF